MGFPSPYLPVSSGGPINLNFAKSIQSCLAFEPTMHPVYISAEENKSSEESKEQSAFQRPHRSPGQLELGATEVAEGRGDSDIQRQVVPPVD